MSSIVYDPSSQCDGKRQLRDRREARKIRNDTRGGEGHLRIYKCPHCGWFHLGHARPAPHAYDELQERIDRLAEFWDCTTEEARARYTRELG